MAVLRANNYFIVISYANNPAGR